MFQRSEISPDLDMEERHTIRGNKEATEFQQSQTVISVEISDKKKFSRQKSNTHPLTQTYTKSRDTKNNDTNLNHTMNNKPLTYRNSSLTKFALLQKVDLAYIELWRNAQQQTIPRSKNFHKLFLPSTSSIIFGVLSLIFIALGLAVHFSNESINEITVKYNMDDTEVTFSVQETLQPPIHIYYEITNFYGNSRLYVRDAPTSIYSESSCVFVITYKQAFDVRTNDGSLTLPDLRTNVFNSMTIFPDDKLAYPCGLSSVSIFNDEIEILNDSDEQIPISSSTLDNDWDLVQYMDLTANIGKNQPWKVEHNLDYRIWLHPPSTADFRKPYGTIKTQLNAGTYTLKINKNLWPSEAWSCTKAFTLTKVSSLGGKNSFLTIFLFATGGVYALFAITLLVIFYSRTVFISKTFRIANLPGFRYDISF